MKRVVDVARLRVSSSSPPALPGYHPQVKHVVDVARAMGREIATPAEAREILPMPNPNPNPNPIPNPNPNPYP